MTLSKEQSRKRYGEIRDLWCRWDPIGVMDDPGWPRDEYDAYLGPTLRMLERGAGRGELADYLSHAVGEYMGLGERGVRYAQPMRFAEKLLMWFDTYWKGP